MKAPGGTIPGGSWELAEGWGGGSFGAGGPRDFGLLSQMKSTCSPH